MPNPRGSVVNVGPNEVLFPNSSIAGRVAHLRWIPDPRRVEWSSEA